MRTHVGVLLGIALLLAPLHTGAKARKVPPPLQPVAGDHPDAVSMLAIIATPEIFDGRAVQVIGYLDIEFEGTALYLHREDFEYSIQKNALDIHVPDRWAKTPRGYVIVEATVDASHHGHGGAFAASLKDVTRLDRWGRWGRLTGR